MLVIVLIMVLTVLVGGAVIVYVAYPHRGEDLPVAPVLGDAMRRGVGALPTIGVEEGEHWFPLAPRVPSQVVRDGDTVGGADARPERAVEPSHSG